MSEDIFEHTTSIAGLTCKPLSILSETIFPKEMRLVRGGNGGINNDIDEDLDPGPITTGLPGAVAPGSEAVGNCKIGCIKHCCDEDPDQGGPGGMGGGGLTGTTGRGGGDGGPDRLTSYTPPADSGDTDGEDFPGPSEIVNEIADTWNDAVDYVVDFVAENFDIYLTEDAEIEAEIEAIEEEERQREEEERQRLDEEENEGSLDGMEGDFDLGDSSQVLV